MSTGERVGRAARRLWRLPCKLMLATMAVCLGAREWYPLSPFPMYAGFGPSAWYICVTDESDRPLPTARYFGVDATMLRRMFESRVRARLAGGAAPDVAESAAARETLDFLLREARPQPDSPGLPERLRLQRTALRLEAEGVGRLHETLATVEPE
ncbi:MAG: hypothetical protein ACRERC_00690 [Candidatus Binatia bacterium]